jgi:hypothetical protein
LSKACLRKPEPGSIKECLSADNHFYELAIWISKENGGKWCK